MSRADTHMIRSHRSRRRYKPTYKTILNKAAKARKGSNEFLRGIMRSITF